eukprot:1464067-Rhodomonas_salina.1
MGTLSDKGDTDTQLGFTRALQRRLRAERVPRTLKIQSENTWKTRSWEEEDGMGGQEEGKRKNLEKSARELDSDSEMGRGRGAVRGEG